MSGILVHLMRHGIPQQPGLLLGHRDDPPLPAGIDLCIARSMNLTFAEVVSSDLSRAFKPADEIAGQRGIPHRIDPDWRELDFGDWTGLAPEAVDPAAHALFWNDPQHCPPPGGERWSDLCDRAACALGRLEHPTLILTHGGAMRAALAVLFHMEHSQTWAFDFPYSSVLSLQIWPGEAAQIVGLRT